LLELTTKRSNFWYILPIILGFLGGIIAYFVLRKSDQKKSKICLIIGIGISVLWITAVVNAGSSERNQPDEEIVERAIQQGVAEAYEQRIANLKQEVAELKEQVNELEKSPKIVSDAELKRQIELEEAEYQAELKRQRELEAEYQAELEAKYQKNLERERGSEFDPVIVASAKKNIPQMQNLPKAILKECKNVKSLSGYITFGLAVESMLAELVEVIDNIDAVLTTLEVNGYDKHPEVGPLIKDARSLSLEVSECIEELQRKYG